MQKVIILRIVFKMRFFSYFWPNVHIKTEDIPCSMHVFCGSYPLLTGYDQCACERMSRQSYQLFLHPTIRAYTKLCQLELW